MTVRGRAWWLGIAGAVVVGVAAVLVFIVVVRQHQEQPSDCQVAREMVAYNASHSVKAQQELVADSGHETDLNEMRQWADQLRQFSARIKDDTLAKSATDAADTANRAVEVVQQGRTAEPTSTAPLTPATWPAQYAKLDHQLRDDFAALDKECPAA